MGEGAHYEDMDPDKEGSEGWRGSEGGDHGKDAASQMVRAKICLKNLNGKLEAYGVQKSGGKDKLLDFALL